MTSRRIRLIVPFVLALLTLGLVAAPASSAHGHHTQLPQWRLLDTGTTTHFRGLSVVSRNVAWLGGYDGTVLRTVDGGRTWINASPAGASTLQFRDISAFDARHAVAMAAGTGTDSRLYQTSDGGRTWRLAYENTNDAAFFDCMSFYDSSHGLVMSDPVDGKFRILSTRDGGRDWTVLPNTGMPPALTGEAGFAASGECLTTSGRDAWFGAGGSTASRIFHSRDGGYHWTVTNSPIVAGARPACSGWPSARRGSAWRSAATSTCPRVTRMSRRCRCSAAPGSRRAVSPADTDPA